MADSAIMRKPRKIELVHEDTKTLEQILGKDRPEIEDPLGLLAATVDISVFESSDALFYRVYFPESPFVGKDLINLITYTRPANSVSEFGVQYRGEIKADLNLPDYNNEVSKKLVEMHERLFDPHWSEFLKYHRTPFMNAVLAFSEKEINERFDTEIAELVTKEHAVSNLELFISKDGLISDFLSLTYHILEDWLRENKPDITQKRIREMGTEDSRNLLRELPQELKEDLVGGQRLLGGHVVDIEGPAKLIWDCDYLGYSPRCVIKYLGDKCVKIQSGDSFSILRFEGGSFKEMERNIKPSYSLTPLVLWKRDKNTGQRSYLSSDAPHVLVEDLMQGKGKQSNTLLGLVAFTYLSLKQRDQLPSELHGRPILEAQQLLVLLMKEGYLVNNIPLFPRAEALYSK